MIGLAPFSLSFPVLLVSHYELVCHVMQASLYHLLFGSEVSANVQVLFLYMWYSLRKTRRKIIKIASKEHC
jgi:hypothetical protein